MGTHVHDPVERLAQITRVTNALKRRHDETGSGSLVGLGDLVPPRTGRTVARLTDQMGLARWGPLAYNVVVSNVPGPDLALYCNGALVESAYPMGPITDWSAVNVTVASYRRQLTFGGVTCPEVVSDIDQLRDDIDTAIDALRFARAR